MISVPAEAQISVSPENALSSKMLLDPDLWQSLWFENLPVSNLDDIEFVGFWISQIFSCNM